MAAQRPPTCNIFQLSQSPKKGYKNAHVSLSLALSLSVSLSLCVCAYLHTYVWHGPGQRLKFVQNMQICRCNCNASLTPLPLPHPPNAAKCISYKVILHMAAGPGATHHLVMAKNVISGFNCTDKIQRSRVCIRFARWLPPPPHPPRSRRAFGKEGGGGNSGQSVRLNNHDHQSEQATAGCPAHLISLIPQLRTDAQGPVGGGTENGEADKAMDRRTERQTGCSRERAKAQTQFPHALNNISLLRVDLWSERLRATSWDFVGLCVSSPRLIAKSVNYQPNYLKCTIDIVWGEGLLHRQLKLFPVSNWWRRRQAPHWRKEHSIHSCLWIVIHCMQHGLSVSSRIPSQAHAAHSASSSIPFRKKCVFLLYASFCSVETFTIRRKYFRMLHNLIDP